MIKAHVTERGEKFWRICTCQEPPANRFFSCHPYIVPVAKLLSTLVVPQDESDTIYIDQKTLNECEQKT